MRSIWVLLVAITSVICFLWSQPQGSFMCGAIRFTGQLQVSKEHECCRVGKEIISRSDKKRRFWSDRKDKQEDKQDYKHDSGLRFALSLLLTFHAWGTGVINVSIYPRTHVLITHTRVQPFALQVLEWRFYFCFWKRTKANVSWCYLVLPGFKCRIKGANTFPCNLV